MPLPNRTAITLCFAAIACGGGGGGPSGPAPVASVTVSLAKSSLVAGETTTATATTKDGSGALLTGRVVTWSTSNNAIATASSDGVITAVSVGTTNVVATSEGRTGITAVTVLPPPVATVSVTLASSAITIGSTTQASAIIRDANGALLTGRSLSWSSDNPLVATVNSSGIVSAVGVGTANITAGSEGRTGSAPLTVDPTPITSVTV